MHTLDRSIFKSTDRPLPSIALSARIIIFHLQLPLYKQSSWFHWRFCPEAPPSTYLCNPSRHCA